MLPLDGIQTMRDLLEARDVPWRAVGPDLEVDGSHAEAVWDAFREYIRQPVYEPFTNEFGLTLRADPEADGDMLLFEVAEAKPGTFALYFTRQFSFTDADDDYHGMNALSVIVNAQEADIVAPAPVTMWGAGGPPPEGEPAPGRLNPEWFGHADSWARAVEGTPDFDAVVRRGRATSIEVVQSDI